MTSRSPKNACLLRKCGRTSTSRTAVSSFPIAKVESGRGNGVLALVGMELCVWAERPRRGICLPSFRLVRPSLKTRHRYPDRPSNRPTRCVVWRPDLPQGRWSGEQVPANLDPKRAKNTRKGKTEGESKERRSEEIAQKRRTTGNAKALVCSTSVVGTILTLLLSFHNWRVNLVGGAPEAGVGAPNPVSGRTIGHQVTSTVASSMVEVASLAIIGRYMFPTNARYRLPNLVLLWKPKKKPRTFPDWSG